MREMECRISGAGYFILVSLTPISFKNYPDELLVHTATSRTYSQHCDIRETCV